MCHLCTVYVLIVSDCTDQVFDVEEPTCHKKHIQKQESIPVGCVPPDFVLPGVWCHFLSDSMFFLRWYGVTSCFVPCYYRGLVPEGGVRSLREGSSSRGTDLVPEGVSGSGSGISTPSMLTDRHM